MPGQCCRLIPARRRETDARRAADQLPTLQLMLGMADEQKGGRAAQYQGSPLMKASVRRRASSSVNWRGGDFMK